LTKPKAADEGPVAEAGGPDAGAAEAKAKNAPKLEEKDDTRAKMDKMAEAAIEKEEDDAIKAEAAAVKAKEVKDGTSDVAIEKKSAAASGGGGGSEEGGNGKKGAWGVGGYNPNNSYDAKAASLKAVL